MVGGLTKGGVIILLRTEDENHLTLRLCDKRFVKKVFITSTC